MADSPFTIYGTSCRTSFNARSTPFPETDTQSEHMLWHCSQLAPNTTSSPSSNRLLPKRVHSAEDLLAHIRPRGSAWTDVEGVAPASPCTRRSGRCAVTAADFSSPLRQHGFSVAQGLSGPSAEDEYMTEMEPFLLSELLPSNEATPVRFSEAAVRKRDKGPALGVCAEAAPTAAPCKPLAPIMSQTSSRISFTSLSASRRIAPHVSAILASGRSLTPVGKTVRSASPFHTVKPVCSGGDALRHINRMVNRVPPPARTKGRSSQRATTASAAAVQPLPTPEKTAALDAPIAPAAPAPANGVKADDEDHLDSRRPATPSIFRAGSSSRHAQSQSVQASTVVEQKDAASSPALDQKHLLQNAVSTPTRCKVQDFFASKRPISEAATEPQCRKRQFVRTFGGGLATSGLSSGSGFPWQERRETSKSEGLPLAPPAGPCGAITFTTRGKSTMPQPGSVSRSFQRVLF